MPLTAVADRGRLFGTSRSGRTAVHSVAALLTGLLSGLLTGVYHGFAVGILPGLDRLSDAAFVETMDRVTEVIVNPAFMLGFLGAPLLTSVAGSLLRRNSWVIAGLVQNVAGPACLTCRSTARFAGAADRDVAEDRVAARVPPENSSVSRYSAATGGALATCACSSPCR